MFFLLDSVLCAGGGGFQFLSVATLSLSWLSKHSFHSASFSLVLRPQYRGLYYALVGTQLICQKKNIMHPNYSETLNNEYIGRIYEMSSWQISMSFILYYVNFIICENK